MNKLELIELDIESIGFEGISVARKNNMVYFVKNGLPGDKVIARILKKKKNYVETQVEEITIPSPYRIIPKCSHFGVCGGCTWQNLQYEHQLYWKRHFVSDNLKRIGKINPDIVEPLLPSPLQYYYRNKMEFSFGTSRWVTNEEIASSGIINSKNFALGLHIPGRFDKVLDIYDCHLIETISNDILDVMRKKALTLGVNAFHARNQSGFLRELTIRKSECHDELMIILTINTPVEKNEKIFLEWFCEDFPEMFPQASNIIYAINSTQNPVSVSEYSVIKGKGYLIEKIHDIDFKISPFSFFQTNSSQLNNFISIFLNYCSLDKEMTLWDFYCGCGSITLPASKKCKHIYGFELFEGSVEIAKKNAELNKIENAEFFAYNLHSKLPGDYLNNFPKPDVLIMDPPRAGVQKYLIDYILTLLPSRIVYVSCNPATLARDLNLFNERYSVKKVKPIDMFPNTFHVESVALLECNNC